MKNIELITAGCIGAFICFILVSLFPAQKLGGAMERNSFSAGVTNASTTTLIGPYAQNVVMARNVNRQYARITNLGPKDVYLLLSDSTDSTDIEGIFLSAGSTTSTINFYEITPNNLWIGAVYGIAPNGTTTLIYVEK